MYALHALVARPVNQKELNNNPEAQKSLDVEWEKLVKKHAWVIESVREWDDVRAEAKHKGKKVHVGKVFEICVETGLHKFKGGTVFQGNNVQDENSSAALFSELGSSLATMEAGNVLDAYGSQPGYAGQRPMANRLILRLPSKARKHGYDLPETVGRQDGQANSKIQSSGLAWICVVRTPRFGGFLGTTL